jgi:hypothetical protein
MKPRYVMGGMGDVLLSLEDALQEKEINLYSHAHAAPRLLEPFGIRVRYEHFTDRQAAIQHVQTLPSDVKAVIRDSSLEDVFVKLTGKKVEADGNA